MFSCKLNPVSAVPMPVRLLRVLRHELAADGEVEDGLAEVLDLVGAGGEGGEVVEGEAGMGAEVGRDRAR